MDISAFWSDDDDFPTWDSIDKAAIAPLTCSGRTSGKASGVRENKV